MAQVIVRHLDDEVVLSLKLKAHALEQDLRDILRQAAELTKPQKLALIEQAKQKQPLEDDSTDLIHEDRDTR